MNKYGILTPIPAKMTIEPGQEGYIKRLESAYKIANFEKDGLPYYMTTTVRFYEIYDTLIAKLIISLLYNSSYGYLHLVL